MVVWFSKGGSEGREVGVGGGLRVGPSRGSEGLGPSRGSEGWVLGEGEEGEEGGSEGWV